MPVVTGHIRLNRPTPQLEAVAKKKIAEHRDQDGKLDVGAWLEDIVHTLLSHFDVDKNQQIDLQEFRKLCPMLRLAGQS